MAKTYVFTVRHPNAYVDARETVDLEGKFNPDAAKKAIKAKFPESSRFFFQGVEASKQEQSESVNMDDMLRHLD